MSTRDRTMMIDTIAAGREYHETGDERIFARVYAQVSAREIRRMATYFGIGYYETDPVKIRMDFAQTEKDEGIGPGSYLQVWQEEGRAEHMRRR